MLWVSSVGGNQIGHVILDEITLEMETQLFMICHSDDWREEESATHTREIPPCSTRRNNRPSHENVPLFRCNLHNPPKNAVIRHQNHA